jgi:phosphoribosylaminoimidazole (AIR) synthetase
MGIGMVAVVAVEKVEVILRFIRGKKHKAWVIGEAVRGRGIARMD